MRVSKAARIDFFISLGGYATAVDYVSKLCAIVEKWTLTRFDTVSTVSTESGKEAEKTVYYRVRKE